MNIVANCEYIIILSVIMKPIANIITVITSEIMVAILTGNKSK